MAKKFTRNWPPFEDLYILENMSDAELMDFWLDFHIATKTRLKKLWPGSMSHPSGAKQAIETMAAMALDMNIVREAWRKGETSTARTYARHAEIRYKTLPAWAKWAR